MLPGGGAPPTEEAVIGDWYIDRSGRWQYDPHAPSPSVEHTAMMPVVSRETPSFDEQDEFDEVYEREDGAIYGRVDRDLFEEFDEVDSRTVEDSGAPT